MAAVRPKSGIKLKAQNCHFKRFFAICGTLSGCCHIGHISGDFRPISGTTGSICLAGSRSRLLAIAEQMFEYGRPSPIYCTEHAYALSD